MSLPSAIAIAPCILAIFGLVTCLTCLYMVFSWGRQIQNSAYLRNSLVEGGAQQELKTPLRELHDRAVEGTLGPQCPPPDNYGPTGRLWEPRKYVPTSESAMDWHPANATAEEKARAAAEERDSASLSPWPSNGRPRNGPAM